MTTACVVLCSERKTNPSQQDVDALVGLFHKVSDRFDGTYVVQDFADRDVDGGNGGGGDGNDKPPKFIRGTDKVGLWNFRFCNGNADRDISFPPAGRIEVCILFPSVANALEGIEVNRGQYKVLARIFENVIIVPLSTVTQQADVNDISSKGAA